MGTRIAGCRTAQHTAATCPRGGADSSSLLPATPPPRASVPDGVITASVSSALPQSRAAGALANTATRADMVGATTTVNSSRPDLTADIANGSTDVNTREFNYFFPSVFPAPEPPSFYSEFPAGGHGLYGDIAAGRSLGPGHS